MKIRIILLTIFLIIIFTAAANCAEINNSSQVVIIDMCGLSFENIEKLELNNLKKTIENGYSALMNTNTAKGRNLENGFLTLGAGRITYYGGLKGEAYSADEITNNGEKAEKKYYQRTGKKTSQESIVVIDLQEAINRTGEKYGQLGEELRKRGLKTALLGNFDSREELGRSAALMIMDSAGIIDKGVIDYKTTDYDQILNDFNEFKKTADLLLIETGELRRLENIKQKISPVVYEANYKEYAKKFDNFLGKIKKSISKNTLFVLLNPVPSKESLQRKELMSPVILWSKDMKSGVLTSETTKREGIVSNLDIMPTILNHLNIPLPKATIGKILETIEKKNVLIFFRNLNKKLIFTYSARPILVKGYVFSQIITILLSLFLLLFYPTKIKYTIPILLGVMAGPLALLLVGILPTYNIIISAIAAVLIIFIIVTLSLILDKYLNLSAFIFTAGLTSIVIAVDVMLGSNLIKISTLGYDPMAGARYYGIGNEFMGVLIGSTVIFTGFLLERYHDIRKILLYFIAFYYLFLIYLIGSPYYGINVGGTITSTVVFGIMIIKYGRLKIKKQFIAALLAAPALVVIFMALISINTEATASTHLSRAVGLVIEGNISEILNIVIRKLSMNVKLIKYTIWSRVFLLGLLAFFIIFYKPMDRIKKIKEKYPYIASSIVGILIGSLTALVSNDSGIVAAATMMIYAVAPLIYINNYIDTKYT